MTKLRRGVLKGIVTSNGGTVCEDSWDGATHVVVGAGVPETTLSKLPVEVRVVQADWLSKSVQQGKRLPEADFQVRVALPVIPTTKRVEVETAATPQAASPPVSQPRLESVKKEVKHEIKNEAAEGAKKAGEIAPSNMPQNAEIAQQLKQLAEAYSARGDRWRSWQLAKAERLVRTWPEPLRHPEDFDRISGLGPKTREKCRELLETGSLKRLSDAATHILQEFTCIHGAGESVARRWFQAGCRSLEDLRARQEELQLTRTQRLGLQYVEDFKQRIPRSEAEQLIQLVSEAADKAYGPKQVEMIPCGSMRRGAASMSDIDLVIAPRHGCVLSGGLTPLLVELRSMDVAKEELGGHAPNSPSENGEETHLGIFRLPAPGSLHRRMDLILSRREHLPLVLLNWTGSGLFLRELHRLASYKGLKISSTQLLARDASGNGVQVPVTEEADVFEALGLAYRPPEQRELDDSLMRFVQACKPGGPPLKRQKSESASPSQHSMPASTTSLPYDPKPAEIPRPQISPEELERRQEFQRLDEEVEKCKEKLRSLSEHFSKVLGTEVGIDTFSEDITSALLEDKESEQRQKQDQLAQLREELAELRSHGHVPPPVASDGEVGPSSTSSPTSTKSPKSQRRASQLESQSMLEDLLGKHVNPELMQQLLAAQGETLGIQEQLHAIEELTKVVRNKGNNLSPQEKQQIKELFGKPDIKNDPSSEAIALREEKKKIRELEKQVGSRRDEWSNIEGASKVLRGLAEGNMTNGELMKKVRMVKAAYLRTGDIEDTGTKSTEMQTLQAAAAMARSQRRRNSEAVTTEAPEPSRPRGMRRFSETPASASAASGRTAASIGASGRRISDLLRTEAPEAARPRGARRFSETPASVRSGGSEGSAGARSGSEAPLARSDSVEVDELLDGPSAAATAATAATSRSGSSASQSEASRGRHPPG
eukprot:s198_g7.t1